MYDELGPAIREHIEALRNQLDSQEGNDQDLDIFGKAWHEGGLLPLKHQLRNMVGSTPNDASNMCFVIKTKVAGKNNTALVDEGANMCVLNVDWYESQGVDWKEKFQVNGDVQTHVCLADQHEVPSYGIANVNVALKDAKGKQFVHPFCLMRLGKHNYAQILGFDWKYKYHCVTSLPEYELNIRKLNCVVSGYQVPTHLFQLAHITASPTNGVETPSSPPELVTPAQFSKDLKALTTRLRSMHMYVPPMAFVRQVVVRPSKDTDKVDEILNTKPSLFQIDPKLESEAKILREEIEKRFRKAYADVLDHSPTGINPNMPHRHEVEVPEDAKPFNQKLRRLSPKEVQYLGEYLKEMIEGGRIRPSTSPWGANVLFVPKPCGGMRCVQDYRELNKVMSHDTYPLPRIDVHMDMAQGTFWTKMDLLKGFYQLPMHENSVKYTAFNTLMGKYEFLVMPMGLQNAPGSFMRAMNHIFDGLMWDPNSKQTSGVLVYLDDILIFSQTAEEHLVILEQVLQRLRKYTLQCRFDKCSFAQTEIEYLGFLLSHQGVRMDPKKVEIVKAWPEQPTSKTDIRAFLGIVNYLKRFCPNLSTHSAILSDWSSANCCALWTDDHVQAVRTIKNMLCSDEVLASPKIDPDTNNYYPFTVITDASEVAVGAIMLQQQGPNVSDTKVIAYTSSKFKQAERNYSVHEKELMGVLLAVTNWNCFLEGSKFKVYTDHSSLLWLNKLKDPSRRQSRWVDTLQGHDFEVVYIKGGSNPADAFTRVPYLNDKEDDVDIEPPFLFLDDEGHPIDPNLPMIANLRVALRHSKVHVKVTPSKLREWHHKTQEVLSDNWTQPVLYKSLVANYANDPLFKDCNWLNKHDISYKDGLFFKGSKVVVPKVKHVIKDVLQEHHDSLYGGHLGINKTIEKVTRLFWWLGITQDVKEHVQTCPACQVSHYRNWKPQGQTFDFQPALSPWEVVHVDFAGPFKHKSPGGYNRICIFTDAFTKLAIFVRCKTTLTSEGLAQLYIDNVWKVYGRPSKLVSDNEPIMCAEAYAEVHRILGTKLEHISAYNAKANGAAEVMVKQLKSMLRSYEVQGLRWWKVLAACERGYNDSIHSVTGYTPFYMNFGRHPNVDVGTLLEPIEESFLKEFVHSTQAELSRVHSHAKQLIIDKHIKETAKRNAHRSPTLQYHVGDLVYLETSKMRKTHTLAPLRSGPLKVLEVKALGNSLLLEGFTHPFNVELITPAFQFGYALCCETLSISPEAGRLDGDFNVNLSLSHSRLAIEGQY